MNIELFRKDKKVSNISKVENLVELLKLIPEIESTCNLDMSRYDTSIQSALTYEPACDHSCCVAGWAKTYHIGNTMKYYHNQNFDYAVYSLSEFAPEDLVINGDRIRLWDFLFSVNWLDSWFEAEGRIRLVLSQSWSDIKLIKNTEGGLEIDYKAKYGSYLLGDSIN